MTIDTSVGETDKPSAQQLTWWLAGLVRSRDYGQLAALRRPQALTVSHLTAASYAPTEVQRDIYEQVAFLFAVYHRGASRPRYGHGSLGAAARRIGSPFARGPQDPGATRLVDRLVSSRRIPWRHLQHTVERLRTCDVEPPSWATLADDLSLWHERGRVVHRTWARDFHTGTYRTKETPK